MSEEQRVPDVDELARSMLLVHGAHDDDDHTGAREGRHGSRSKAAAVDPQRSAALREATQRDRERYLTSGLQSVDCRFCHVSVLVKKLGPGTHVGAMEFGCDAALRLLRRGARIGWPDRA